jgi:hypothetical protein
MDACLTAPAEPLEQESQVPTEALGLDAPLLQQKLGRQLQPHGQGPALKIESVGSSKRSGAYFMSNELAQPLPLPEHLVNKTKVIYEALEISTDKLHPSARVSETLHQINEQLMILYQFESMIQRRREDLEMLNEKEEQLKVLVSA